MAKVLFTPDGVVRLGTEKATERIELRAGVMEWMKQFSDVAAALHIGLHCARCKADLIGKNADSDKHFTVLCECREFVGENRDYRAPAKEVQH